jgi:hypothetical protein
MTKENSERRTLVTLLTLVSDIWKTLFCTAYSEGWSIVTGALAAFLVGCAFSLHYSRWLPGIAAVAVVFGVLWPVLCLTVFSSIFKNALWRAVGKTDIGAWWWGYPPERLLGSPYFKKPVWFNKVVLTLAFFGLPTAGGVFGCWSWLWIGAHQNVHVQLLSGHTWGSLLGGSPVFIIEFIVVYGVLLYLANVWYHEGPWSLRTVGAVLTVALPVIFWFPLISCWRALHTSNWGPWGMVVAAPLFIAVVALACYVILLAAEWRVRAVYAAISLAAAAVFAFSGVTQLLINLLASRSPLFGTFPVAAAISVIAYALVLYVALAVLAPLTHIVVTHVPLLALTFLCLFLPDFISRRLTKKFGLNDSPLRISWRNRKARKLTSVSTTVRART